MRALLLTLEMDLMFAWQVYNAEQTEGNVLNWSQKD